MAGEHSNPEQCIPELEEIRALGEQGGELVKLRTLATVETQGQQLPVYALIMGSEDPNAPAIGLFGGVHGVERIGSEVVLAYMHSLIEGLSWSPWLQEQLKKIHIVFMPIVNPGGVINKTRCNPNGIDLMRNAPIDASDKVPFLLGGQRLSRFLPWYRGKKNALMETEAQALCRLVEEHLLPRPFSIALDCHSGYGRQDYLWLPYAGTKKPFPHLAEAHALKNLFCRTYPNHSYYKIEPQSLHYTTHGDLWDYLHLNSLDGHGGTFLPLTLEMGSWLWLKKNPRQIFRFASLFNPVLPHRHRRILRRHLVLMEFLLRAVEGYQHWLPDREHYPQLTEIARQHWYENDA